MWSSANARLCAVAITRCFTRTGPMSSSLQRMSRSPMRPKPIIRRGRGAGVAGFPAVRRRKPQRPGRLPAVLVLTRSDTEGLLELEECVEAVERAFRIHGEGRALAASRRHVPANTGGFHVTAGGLPELLSVKVNGHFPPFEPGGPRRMSGAIVLSDAT